MGHKAQVEGDVGRAGAIRTSLNTVERIAVEDLRALCTKHGVAPASSTQSPLRELLRGPTELSMGSAAPPDPSSQILPAQATAPPVPPAGAQPERQAADTPRSGSPGSSGAGSPTGCAARASDFFSVYGRLRELRSHFRNRSRPEAEGDFKRAIDRTHKMVLHNIESFGGEVEYLPLSRLHATKAEQAYVALQGLARQAEDDDDSTRARAIREALEEIDKASADGLHDLSTKHGVATTPPAQVQEPPAPSFDPFDWRFAYRRLHGLSHYFFEIGRDAAHKDLSKAVDRVERFVRHRVNRFGGRSEDLLPQRSGQVPRSEQMYRALEDMARRAAESGDADRHREIRQAVEEINKRTSKALDRTAGKYGSLEDLARQAGLPGQRVSMPVGPAVTGEAPSVTVPPPLQPVQRMTAPETVPFDPGMRPAGEAVPPHSVSATPTSTAAASPAPLLTPSWLEDDFAVERALIAGELPPGFDASRLTVEAGQFEQFGLAAELAAGRLPLETIDILIAGFQLTDEAGGNALFIEYLTSLKEDIERALLDAYPQRVDPEWLNQVRRLLRRRSESAASGAVARSPVADPWLEPPGPSSRLMPAQTLRPPVEPSAAWPGQQGAETPGFGRRATKPPVSQREAIVERFKSDDALLDAELALQTGGGGALGWSATRWREVLDDLFRLNDAARSNPAAAVARDDIDWSAIEALVGILDIPPPSP